MEKIKTVFLLLLVSIISIPLFVKADSGLDSNYSSGGSIGEIGMSSGSSAFSIIGELVKAQPGDKDYQESHIALSIVCIIFFYIFTNVDTFKLDVKKKNAKKVVTKLAINLIPTVLFSLFCFLTELQLVLYIFVLILYIIILKVVTNKIVKKNLNKKISIVNELDKSFNVKDFNNEAFNVYKDLQIAWMNFEYDKIKELVSDEIFNKYKGQLEQLSSDGQKNIMDKIEFKSNKIIDIYIENGIEIIRCRMKVTCYDYIIDNNEKVLKGKKNKNCNYSYDFIFNKNLKDNKLILVSKKLK